jgi:hypothetical protein
MGSVLHSLKRVGRWAAGSAAVLAGLCAHGLTALIVLAALAVVLALALAVVGRRGTLRWILDSADRSDRMNRMILAVRGDARCLTQGASALPSPDFPVPSQAADPPRGGELPADRHDGDKFDGPLRQQEAVGMVKAPQGGPRP